VSILQKSRVQLHQAQTRVAAAESCVNPSEIKGSVTRSSGITAAKSLPVSILQKSRVQLHILLNDKLPTDMTVSILQKSRVQLHLI